MRSPSTAATSPGVITTRAYIGLIPASAFTKVSSCTILKSFSGGGCGIAVPYFYQLSTCRRRSRPRSPAARRATATSRRTRLRRTRRPPTMITSRGHAGAVRADGLRYGRSTACGSGRSPACATRRAPSPRNSLQKVPTSITWDNPDRVHHELRGQRDLQRRHSSYDEFLPSLDTSLQVLPDVLLRASYSKTIARSDLTSDDRHHVGDLHAKPGSRTATAGNPGIAAV